MHNNISSLEQENNNLIYKFDSLTYTITPINLYDPTHLKCIIRITNQKNNRQCLDKIDLYHANARKTFIKKTVPRIETDGTLLDKDLLEIANLLEKERNKPEMPAEIEVPPEQKKEALTYLKSPSLLDLIIADYKTCGYVGEEKNFITGYLVATSRKLKKPLGMIIISRSGAGKSTLQDAIILFMPPEDVLNYDRISGLAFFYKGRYALKHKLISIGEEAGAFGANYAIRNLLNGKGLFSSVTIKDPITGRMKSADQFVEGPSSLFLGTTETKMDHETLSRFIITTIDESVEQTMRILLKQKENDTLNGHIQNKTRESIITKHHNIQRLLKPLIVINSYTAALNFPSDRLIMRRSQNQYSQIIKAICLLHQYQREIKTYSDDNGNDFQYIEVTKQDIALAEKIAIPLLSRSMDEISPVTRQFLNELKTFTKSRADKNGDSNKFNRRDIRQFTKWNDYQIRRCLSELENMEYIMRVNGYQGKLCTYELIYEGEENKIELSKNQEPEKQIQTGALINRNRLVMANPIRNAVSNGVNV